MTVFLLVFCALGIGFGLLAFIAATQKNRGKNFKPEPMLTFIQFEKCGLALLEALRLEIEEVERGDQSLDIRAKNLAPIIGGTILVRLDYRDPHQIVSPPQILEFSNHLVQERASKGIFITTGRMPEDLPATSELAPMELIDGKRFGELIEQYR